MDDEEDPNAPPFGVEDAERVQLSTPPPFEGSKLA